MSMLTTISYVTAFLSVVPIFSDLSRYSILFTAYPLIRIIGLNMPKNKQERRKYILKTFHNTTLIIFFMLSVYFGLLLYERRYYGFRWLGINLYIIFPMVALIFLLLLILKIISIYKNRRKK